MVFCCCWRIWLCFSASLIHFSCLFSKDFQPRVVWECSRREGSEGNCLQGHGSAQEQELWFLWNPWKVHRKGPDDKTYSATERGKKSQPESFLALSTLNSIWSERNSKASRWLLWNYLYNPALKFPFFFWKAVGTQVIRWKWHSGRLSTPAREETSHYEFSMSSPSANSYFLWSSKVLHGCSLVWSWRRCHQNVFRVSPCAVVAFQSWVFLSRVQAHTKIESSGLLMSSGVSWWP